MEDTARVASHGNGNRPVTNADLQNAVEILGLNIKLSLQEIVSKIEAISTQQIADTKAFETLVSRVEANSQEILTIRAYAHKQGDALTALELRTSPIGFEFGSELVAAMPELRRGIQLLKENEFKTVMTDRETEIVQNAIDLGLREGVEYALKLKEKDALAKLDAVERQMKSRARRYANWHNLDLWMGILGLIALVFLVPIAGELINHFIFGKPF